MKVLTYDALKNLTPERRSELFRNAERLRDKGGQAVLDAIIASGLPLRSGGMTMTDPVFLEMEEIIWSADGRRDALAATASGLPALAGVEPRLQAALGDRYNAQDMGTMNAGWIVGQLMQHLGYRHGKQGKCPPGCVAKTAMTWVPVKR